ncbi:MAG: tetratricopeptide repeat protein [Methylococcaceae bacterium]
MNEASACNNLGYLNLLDGHYSEARNYLQRAISQSPNYHAQAFKNMDKLHDLWQ